MARPHHHHFAKTVLPQLFFAAPGETIGSLFGPKGREFLVHHWNEAAAGLHDAPLPHHGLEALGVSQAGDHQVVFIAMPATVESNEALFIALVFDGTTPSVYFYERCSADGIGGLQPHENEAVLAVLRPGSRGNGGFFPGLTLEDFRVALGRSLGTEVASPVRVSATERSVAPEVDKNAPLFPLLKAKDWHAKALALTMPLPGITHPDAPCIAFARNTAEQYVILTLQEAGDANPLAVFNDAVKNLSAQPADIAMVQGVAVCGGSDFAADRLIDPDFISSVQQQLGTNDLYLCAPHRRAIYAISTGASADTRALFAGMVSTELTRTPPPGAPVSDLVFRVTDGRLINAHKLDNIAPAPAPRPTSDGGYGLGAPYMGTGSGHLRGGNYGLPRAGDAPGEGADRPAARAAGIAAMVMLVLSALGNLAASFLDSMVGGLSTSGFVFWIACAFLMRVPASRAPAIVAVISSFVGVGVSAAFYDSFAGIWAAGAVAACTWGAYTWALGKACSPPKIGAGVTAAVVALTLLWIPMFEFAISMTMALVWLRLIVLMGLAGYVIQNNS